MIYGIGVDTASAARLEKSIASAHFVQRVFGPEERALLQSRGPLHRAQTAAANFAAKEALAKALGTGLSGFVWVQAQALRAQSGAPYFAFSGQLAGVMRQKGLTAHLSLTHEGGFAHGFCGAGAGGPARRTHNGGNRMITPEQIKQDRQIKTYIERADDTLQALGYTEHSFAHVTRVAHFAQKILEELGYDERTCQLAWIAGYMHDIGNVINRIDHAQSGAVMAFRILDKLGMEANEIATICSAIGNHDESTAFPVNAVAAALILADKTDVRRTRVRNRDKASFDIHDRVNYAVEKAATTLDAQEKAVVLTLTLDTEMSAVMDYFEIFLDRMLLCRKAAEKLGLSFRLVVNGQAVM